MQPVSRSDELKTIIKNNPSVVVKFSTPWCTMCKALSKVFEYADSTYLNYNFVEADASGQIMEDFGIRSVPVTKFYRNGLEVKTLVGTYSSNELALNLESVYGER